MTETHYGLRFLVLAVILAANAFFAAAEVSLLTARASRLRQMAEEGSIGARAALELLANPERLLSVIQVGVTLASLAMGWAGEDTLFALFHGSLGPVVALVGEPVVRGTAFVLAFLLLTYAHVVIGEVVPKNLALEKAERIATAFAPPTLVFYRISAPFVAVIEKSAAAISRSIGLKSSHMHAGAHTPEELKTLISLSRGSGVVPPEQEKLLHKTVDFGELTAREIMVPRNEMISVRVDATLEEVLKTMIEQQHSRLPVWKDKPEQIIGVLFYKDLLPVWAERRSAYNAGRTPPEFRVWVWMRKPLFVPETKPCLQMLEEFRQGKSHMAMVVDEHGTIVGLLTIEDVIEQITGEIEDEYDVKRLTPPPESPLIEIDGVTPIRDLETLHGIELPSDAGFETLAGFLMERLGRIPTDGDEIEYEGRRYTVLAMERNRISRVRIEKLQLQEVAESKA